MRPIFLIEVSSIVLEGSIILLLFENKTKPKTLCHEVHVTLALKMQTLLLSERIVVSDGMIGRHCSQQEEGQCQAPSHPVLQEHIEGHTQS